MTDKTPDDGKDGWPDQGEKCDAHDFPTGNQNFQGVPFEIGKGAKSVISLRNAGRPGAADFPVEVTIPIGAKAEGFYFIHGTAFTGPVTVGLYQVQYADGSRIDVPLTSGVNIWDWSGASAGFAREKGTRSNVAWTGSNQIFSTITIYRMLWVNPKPQVAVKAIRFASNGNASLMLAGLTAVLAQGQQDTTPAQLAQARAALLDAGKALDAGKLDVAEKLLRAAISGDPSLTAARQSLADLYERKGDENAAMKVYQEWIAAGAATPLPYNRTGEILEKRKDFKGALDAYTKSLAVEWNQPPIIEAKSRVQKIVLEKK
jgi:predicted negative regulator of RcsB-dependent stress response